MDNPPKMENIEGYVKGLEDRIDLLQDIIEHTLKPYEHTRDWDANTPFWNRCCFCNYFLQDKHDKFKGWCEPLSISVDKFKKQDRCRFSKKK